MIPVFNKDLAVIQKLSDLPNSTDGLTAAELKAKFDEAALEIQKWMNNTLIPALTAANIPFDATAQLNAQTVQDAVQLVFEQIREASSGTIANGSVTKEKLAQTLLERVFGGRVWVSLDKPTANETPEEDFPVGQMWLRPGFTVENDATKNWNVSGCTASVEGHTVTFTGNNTVAQAEATMNLAGIGQDGDRVYVLFSVEDKDPEISSLTVILNGDQEENTALSSHMATLSGSSLSVKFRAIWPSTSLANGSFTIENLAVVNVDRILRQLEHCRDMTDWASYLKNLLPLEIYDSNREMYIQTRTGIWEQIDYEVFPVHRGGTGVDSLAMGEMLYGSGDNTMEKLTAPEADASVLQFMDGRPQWQTGGQAIASMGGLRMMTGNYTGNGVHGRTVELPVEPVVVYIHCTSGPSTYDENDNYTSKTIVFDNPIVLANGSRYADVVSNANGHYVAFAELKGSVISFSFEKSDYASQNAGRTTGLGNQKDKVYTWVAIY